MRLRTKLLLAAVTVFVLALAYAVYAAFHGSPVQRYRTTRGARAYVAATYPGEPYTVEDATYDFKMAGYYCRVNDAAHADGWFDVRKNSDGWTDDRVRRVEGRENTLMRLAKALDDDAEQLLKERFPHRTGLVLCDPVSREIPEETLSAVPLDLPYDRMHFPYPATLTVWVETEQNAPTWDELAARLTELEAIVAEELPCVDSFSVTVQWPYAEHNGAWVPERYDGMPACFDLPREIVRSESLRDALAVQRAAQEAEEAALATGAFEGKETAVTAETP
ncbi:MAG: hypothetical protein Q4C53_03000 [Clostridia bacterium]|nr:hypothetical protein [Clostridia bacterium]